MSQPQPPLPQVDPDGTIRVPPNVYMGVVDQQITEAAARERSARAEAESYRLLLAAERAERAAERDRLVAEITRLTALAEPPAGPDGRLTPMPIIPDGTVVRADTEG